MGENFEENAEQKKSEEMTLPEKYNSKNYKVVFIEKKTKHLQLLVRPSLHEKVKEVARKCGVSVNEFVHSVLEREIFK